MAKKPHIDFPLRENLDGSEELYSQNTNWEPAEQKFTVSDLATHILAQISPAPAANGLTFSEGYELGGILSKNTTLDASTIEFDIKKSKVGLKAFTTNPVWSTGEESFFLTGKNNTGDTENYVGVTNVGNNGIVQIWTRKPTQGSYSNLIQSPFATVIQAHNATNDNSSRAQFINDRISLTFSEATGANASGEMTISGLFNEFKRENQGSVTNFKIQEKTTSSALLEVLFKGLPEYADIAAAQADNYPTEGIFKTPTGFIMITPVV